MKKYYSSDAGYEVAPYMVEIHGVGDAQDSWSANGLRFETKEDANAYKDDLLSRWFGADRGRVIDVRLSELIQAKKRNIDCDEDDSAYIKGWIRETLICIGYGQGYIDRDLQTHFPLEYGEAIEERDGPDAKY